MPNMPKHDDQYELHRLFGTLLSIELSADEKFKVIHPGRLQILLKRVLRKRMLSFTTKLLTKKAW